MNEKRKIKNADIEILKVKRKIPTVIRFSGRVYILSPNHKAGEK